MDQLIDESASRVPVQLYECERCHMRFKTSQGFSKDPQNGLVALDALVLQEVNEWTSTARGEELLSKDLRRKLSSLLECSVPNCGGRTGAKPVGEALMENVAVLKRRGDGAASDEARLDHAAMLHALSAESEFALGFYPCIDDVVALFLRELLVCQDDDSDCGNDDPRLTASSLLLLLLETICNVTAPVDSVEDGEEKRASLADRVARGDGFVGKITDLFTSNRVPHGSKLQLDVLELLINIVPADPPGFLEQKASVGGVVELVDTCVAAVRVGNSEGGDVGGKGEGAFHNNTLLLSRSVALLATLCKIPGALKLLLSASSPSSSSPSSSPSSGHAIPAYLASALSALRVVATHMNDVQLPAETHAALLDTGVRVPLLLMPMIGHVEVSKLKVLSLLVDFAWACITVGSNTPDNATNVQYILPHVLEAMGRLISQGKKPAVVEVLSTGQAKWMRLVLLLLQRTAKESDHPLQQQQLSITNMGLRVLALMAGTAPYYVALNIASKHLEALEQHYQDSIDDEEVSADVRESCFLPLGAIIQQLVKTRSANDAL
jgi:hypothetical protein